MGQGAKPGIGGHLPGAKIVGDVSRTRMIPEGSDAISPAPHHDIYSIEDLRQLVFSLKEATEYKKPIIVKVAAVHNIAAIASGIARSGADIIAIDGFRGGTGAAPTRIRDNVGINNMQYFSHNLNELFVLFHFSFAKVYIFPWQN